MANSMPMQVVGVLPPPLGLTANFVNPPDQTADTIALHTVCLFFVTLCVSIRLYTRQFISHAIGIEDYLCIFAFMLTISFSALLIVANKRGLGRHIWDEPVTWLSPALKLLTYTEFVYIILAMTIKLSCLFFYRRVFAPNRRMKWLIDGGILVIFLTYIALWFSTVFECTPIRKSWNPLLPGHCLKPRGLPYASGVINVVSDIYVLIVPIPCIWDLNMDITRKLRVLSIFSLGIFICIASIVRLAQTRILYDGSIDSTWNLSKISIWAVIEVNIGIMCSCMLAFPTFFDRYGIHGLSLLLSKLTSRGSSGRGEKETGDTSGHSHKKRVWSPISRSNNRSLDSSEYADLHGRGNAIQLNGIKRDETADDRQMNVSTEDAEAWPGNAHEPSDHPASHRHTIERFDA